VAPYIANGTVAGRFILGIAAEAIADGADGYVIAKGKLRDFNTNSFAPGTVLWASPTTAGAFTATEPSAPNIKAEIAFVIHQHTNNGVLAVRRSSGTKLSDDSQVEITSPATGQLLRYNSNRWENTSIEQMGIVTGTGTAGQVSFWNGTNTQSGDNGLWWDNSSKRLGIGITSPARSIDVESSAGTSVGIRLNSTGTGGRSYSFFSTNNGSGLGGGKFGIYDDTAQLGRIVLDSSGNVGFATNSDAVSSRIQIKGAGTTSATSTFNATNSSGTSLFFVRDDGNVGIGTTSPNNLLQLTATAGLSHARWTESSTTVGFVGGANGIITGLNGSFAVRGESGLVLSGAGNSATLFLNTSGNVGIGTTSPVSPLQVNGTAQFGDLGSMTFTGAPVNIRTTSTESIAFTHTAVRTYTLGVNSSGTFNIRDFDAPAAPADRLSITAAGNVLIGTTADAGFKLDVSGTGRFTSNLLAQKVQVGTAATINDATGVGNTLQFANYSAGVFVTGSADSYVYKTSSVFGGLAAQTLIFQTRSDVAGGGFAFVGGSTPSAVAIISDTGAATFSSSVTADSLTILGNARFYAAGNWMQFQENVLTSLNNDGAHIRSIVSIQDAPTYSWKGDTDTGMFTPSANTIAFSTAGSERMRITSAGNVGIGTTTVTFDTGSGLRIERSGASTIRLAGEGAAAEMSMTSSGYQIDSRNGYIRFITGAASGTAVERLRITSAGNLLIGSTTDSGEKLQVTGTMKVTGASTFGGTMTTSVTSGLISVFDSTNVNGGYIVLRKSNVDNLYIGNRAAVSGDGGTGYDFYSTSGLDLRFFAGATKALTLATTGAATFSSSVTATNYNTAIANKPTLATAVGAINVPYITSNVNEFQTIGFSYPSSVDNVTRWGMALTATNFAAGIADLIFFTATTERLRINNSGAATFSSSVKASNLYLGSLTNEQLMISGTGSRGIGVSTITSGDPFVRLYDNTTIRADIWWGRSGSYMGVNSLGAGSITAINPFGGNVGIGTTTPGYKLDVVGTIRSDTLVQVGTANDLLLSTSEITRNGTLSMFAGSGASLILGVANEKMRITSAGNVGIGTSSPNVALEVSGASNLSSRIRAAKTSSGTIEIGADRDTFGSPYISAITNSNLDFFTNDTHRMRITSAGNVGINATAPAEKLFVLGNIGVGAGTYNGGVYANSSTSTADSNWGFDFFQTDGTNYSTRLKYYPNTGENRRGGIFNSRDNTWVLYGDSNNTPNVIIPSGNVGIGTTSPQAKLDVLGSIHIRTGSSLFADTIAGYSAGVVSIAASTNFIVPTGNVGIGTTSPAEKLDVFGAIQARPLANGSSGNYWYMIGSITDVTNFGVANGIVVESAGVNSYAMTFGTQTTYLTGITEKMRITSAGNVGIGTTAPGFKLDVIGDIRASSYFVGGSSGQGFSWSNFTYGSYLDLDNSQNALRIRNSANTIMLEVNGGSNYFTGNLGIGTTSPNAPLDVTSATSNSSIIQQWSYNSAPSAYRLQLNTIVTSGLVKYSFDMLNNSTVYNNTLVLDRGNVGIGTTSPDRQLEVTSTTGGTLRLKRDDTSLENNDTIGTVEFFTNDADGPHIASYIKGLGADLFGNFGRYGALAFGVSVTANTDAVEIMRITEKGNVGINTTAPAKLLSVRSLDNAVTPFAGFYALNETQGVEVWYGGIQMAGSNSNVALSLASKGAESIVFNTNSTEKMRITSAGNVSIGNTNDTYKLDVSGTGRFTNDLRTDNVLLAGGATNIDSSLAVQISTTGGGTQKWFGANKNGSYGLLLGYSETVGLSGVGAYIRQVTSDPLFFVVNNATTALTLASTGAATFSNLAGTGTRMVVADANGLLSTQAIGSGAITGSGTTNYVPKFTGASAIGDSQIFDNGTNVGIGTATLGSWAKLQAAGNIALTGTLLSFSDNLVGGSTPAYLDYNYSTGKLIVGSFGPSASGHIVLETGGTEKVRITSTGNVGIGTSSPSAKLVVESGGFAVQGLSSNPTSGFGLEFWNQTDTSYIGSYNRTTSAYRNMFFFSNNTIFETGGAERMRITSAGNVGIGTTSPDEKLHVEGTIQAGDPLTDVGFISAIRRNSSSTTDNIELYQTNITEGNSAGIKFISIDNNGNKVNGLPAYIRGLFVDRAAFSYNTALVFGTSNTERLRITSAGDVGIGTTSPLGPLEVYRSATGGLGGHIIVNNNGTAVGNETALMFGDGGLTGIRAAISCTTEDAPYTGELRFKSGVNAYASLTTNMVIKGNGNVGIGTTAPGEKLEVGGNIKSNAGNGEGFVLNGGLAIHRLSGTELGFITSSTERMRIAAGGNVGIGTTAPDYKLSIQGNAGIEQSEEYFYFNSSYVVGSNARGKIRAVGAGGGSGFGGDLRLSSRASNNVWNEDVLTIANTGDVGIGTTSPGSKLSVNGSNSGSVPLVNLVASGSGAFQRGVRILNSGMVASDSIMYAAGRSDDAKNMGQFYFTFAGAGSNSNRISMGLHSVDDVLNIMGSGNVLIGTTSDAGDRLQVNGRVRIATIDNATGDFLTVSSAGVIQKRTAAQTLSDIGAALASGSANYIQNQSAAVQGAAFRINGTGSVENMAIGGAGSFGGSAKSLFIAQTTTAPNSNPTGGVVTYVEDGIMKARSANGNITFLTI
jgi:hypothetical protein